MVGMGRAAVAVGGARPVAGFLFHSVWDGGLWPRLSPAAGLVPALRRRWPGGARQRSAARWPGGLRCRQAGAAGHGAVPLFVRLVVACLCGSGLSPRFRTQRLVSLSVSGCGLCPGAQAAFLCACVMDKMTSCPGLEKPTPRQR